MMLHDAFRLQLTAGQPEVIAVVGGGGKSSVVFRLARDLAAQGKRAIATHTARIAAFQTAWAPAVVFNDGPTLPLDAIAQALDQYGWCLLTGPIAADRRVGLELAAIDQLARRSPELGVHAISIEADGSKMRPLKAPAAHEPVLPDSTTLLAPVMGLDAIGAPIDERHVHRPELVRQLLGAPADSPLRLAPHHAAQVLIDPSGGAKAKPAGAQLVPVLNKADTLLRRTYGRLIAQTLAQSAQSSLLTAAASEQNPVVERWAPVAVAVLAGGASRRMGSPKQLTLVHGQTMAARAAQVALAGGDGPVYFVTGAYADAVEPALQILPSQARARVQVVHNPDWEAGQATSMHAALAALPPEAGALILMPVDQPFLEPRLLRSLVGAWRGGAQLVAPAVDGDLRGAPALFDRTFFPALRLVTGDTGGRALLRAYRDQVVPIQAAATWLYDIDTPTELP